MLKTVVAIIAGAGVRRWCMVSRRQSSTVSSAVNSMLLRSLKDHYLEVSNMAPPPVLPENLVSPFFFFVLVFRKLPPSVGFS